MSDDMTDPENRCVACGHSCLDHDEGDMGARVNDDWLCHQDDHSCYVTAESEIAW